MPTNIYQWARDLRNKLRSSASRQNREPELPYLPFQSKIVLATDRNCDEVSESPFFARLPPEIRRKILVSAFGGRTLHMNLRLGTPLLPRSERPALPSTLQRLPHGGVTAAIGNYWDHDVLDAARQARADPLKTKPVWQWWGCECHRRLPPGDERIRTPLWKDECVQGKSSWCEFYPGDVPDKCLIGCMGWLTTSKRACAEGLEILYGTNTIVVSSGKLIDSLLASVSPNAVQQRVLVPTHLLDLITKLEVMWDWGLFQRADGLKKQSTDRSHMKGCLDLLPKAFPNLVTLYMSYSDGLYRRREAPDNYLSEIDEELLFPLARLAGRLPRLRKCTIELPSNTFGPLMSRAYSTQAKIENKHLDDIKFQWKCDGVTDGGHNIDTGDISIWIKSGVESDLRFDYQGKPFSMSTRPQVLL